MMSSRPMAVLFLQPSNISTAITNAPQNDRSAHIPPKHPMPTCIINHTFHSDLLVTKLHLTLNLHLIFAKSIALRYFRQSSIPV